MMIASCADRGFGPAGSKTYHASAPVPPELTRQSLNDRSLLPGPDVGWRGCVTRADAGAATDDGGDGTRWAVAVVLATAGRLELAPELGLELEHAVAASMHPTTTAIAVRLALTSPPDRYGRAKASVA